MFDKDRYDKELRATLFNNYTYQLKNRNIRTTAEQDRILQDVIFQTFRSSDVVGAEIFDAVESLSNDALEEKIKTDEQYNNMYEVLEFIVLTMVSAYYKLSNIDVKNIKEGDFGFKDCSCMLVNIAPNFNAVGADSTIRAELDSKLRGLSFNEYIANKLYIQDLENICGLFNKSKQYSSALDKEVLVKIKETFINQIDGYELTIKNRYNYMLDGTFGIDTYVGVYTCQDTVPFIGIKNGESYTLEPVEQLSNHYHKVLSHYVDVGCQEPRQFTERQFDKTLIYNASLSGMKPLYFPQKMLELIKLCRFTKNKSSHTYTILGGKETESKSKYIRKVTDYLIDELIDFLFFCYKIELGVASQPREEANPVIMEHLNREKDDEWKTIFDKMVRRANYFIDCVTTCVILDKLDTSKRIIDKATNKVVTKIDHFRFKLCLPDSGITFTNESFCEELRESLGFARSVMNGFNKDEQKLDGEGYYFIDLEYIYDQQKYYAKPIFAYQALETLLEKQSDDADGSPLDWNNILLGKNARDGLVTSRTDGGGISLQNHKAHFIYAGSRSGKGVMGYNIFATAVASQLPIFYIDGKPDTSVVLKGIGKRMFALNAGDHDILMDSKKLLVPENYNYIVPNYMKDIKGFGNKKDLSYFAAFKGIMLVLTMMIYANNESYVHAKELANMFPNGIVLILDEFTKFQENFTLKETGLNSAGLLSSAYINNDKLSNSITQIKNKYKKITQSIKKEQTKGEKANDAVIDSELDELSNFSGANPYDMSALYATALYNAYKSLATEISNLQNASSRVWNTLQTFIIGQNLQPILNSLSVDSDFYIENSGSISKSQKARKIDPLVNKLFANMKPDFILGYQPDRTDYLAQNVDGSKTSEYFTPSRRMFAYRDMSLTEDNVSKIVYTSAKLKGDALKNYLNEWHYFKPFLILNNAITPVQELENNGKSHEEALKTAITEIIDGIGQDGNEVGRDTLKDKLRKGASVSNFNTYVDSQYVNQCISACEDAGLTYLDVFGGDTEMKLHPGVGFEGYVNMMNCPNVSDSLNKSGDIADYFVKTVLHYDGGWEKFCCDLRPEYWICPDDFDSNGEYKPVNERLKSSFFHSILISNNFGEMFGAMTESLAPYYGGIEISDVDRNIPEVRGVDESEIIRDEDDYHNNDSDKENMIPDVVTVSDSEVNNEEFNNMDAEAQYENYYANKGSYGESDNKEKNVEDNINYDEPDPDDFFDDEDEENVLSAQDVMNIIIEEFPENASKAEMRAVSDGVFALLREKGYVIR